MEREAFLRKVTEFEKEYNEACEEYAKFSIPIPKKFDGYVVNKVAALYFMNGCEKDATLVEMFDRATSGADNLEEITNHLVWMRNQSQVSVNRIGDCMTHILNMMNIKE